MSQHYMALVSLSSKCFSVVDTALEAVKNGDARLTSFLLNSIKQDGSLLRKQTLLLRDQLNEAEQKHQQKVEALTRDMNKLYKQEENLKKKKAELETRKHLMTKERERCSQKKQDASRRYQETQKEWKEAERKYREFQDYWWVPVYGAYVTLRELFESNAKKVSVASRDMRGYERDMQRAEKEIKWANSALLEVHL